MNNKNCINNNNNNSLYFTSSLAVDEKFKGIGIRIEDDVVVTEDSHENLTAKLPKERQEIITWMAESE